MLKVGPFEYEVLIPEFARRQLQHEVGREISLHTIEYLEGNPMHGRLTPRLIGFLKAVEREFFDLFCEVDGVGVKKALRAMVRPVREVATAIEEQDVKTLSTLPGIGPATSERIVAKLRRRMPKFALLGVARGAGRGRRAPRRGRRDIRGPANPWPRRERRPPTDRRGTGHEEEIQGRAGDDQRDLSATERGTRCKRGLTTNHTNDTK